MRDPLVSVVVPALDEQGSLSECLAAIAAQDIPLDQLEVLVIDGGSTDGTGELARRFMASVGLRGQVIHNPARTTPSSLNVGLAAATGDYLLRVDARSLVPPDYVSRCVGVLASDERVAVVGGAQVASAPPGAGLVSRSIARALRHPYATGFARYRRGARSGATDTVYLGAFRTVDLDAVGGWDTRYQTNQDYDLNRRLAERGLVWFERGLEVGYRPRQSLKSLATQYRRFGRWKMARWLEDSGRPSARQGMAVAIPPLALGVALATGRRWPRGTLATLVALAVAFGWGGRDGAGADERLATTAAIGVINLGWWFGCAEQLYRFSRGERLLGPVVAS